jgi:beta-xylosidase
MMTLNTWAILLGLAAFLIQPAVCTESSTPRPKEPLRTYRNPLLPDREIADPFVLRVDGKYYLYPTTDARGYEVFVSDDLVHWGLKASVFNDPRGGDWAPGLFHNKRGDGKFYLYCIVEGPDAKLCLVYHQKWNAERNFHRFLAIDPIWFDEGGFMHTKPSRDTDQPAP